MEGPAAYSDGAEPARGEIPARRPASSAIGRNVDAALLSTRSGTLPSPHCFTSGVLTHVVVNPPARRDLAILEVVRELRLAKREFCLQAYIFDVESVAARELLGALRDKQREIPEFKVFLAINRRLLSSGAEVLRALDRYSVKAAVSFHPMALGRASLHSKAYLIDGRVAYVGGDNVDDPNEADVLARLEGSVVPKLLMEFDDAFTSGRIVRAYSTSAIVDLRESHARTPEAAPCAAEVPMTVLTKRGTSWFGGLRRHDSNEGILAAMRSAEREIKLCSPNFNDIYVWDAITDAAARNVQVKLMIPHDYNSLAALVDRASNAAIVRYRELLPADVAARIEIRWFSSNRRKLQWNHAKYLDVDGCWAYVGSQNMDNQAFWYSRELGIGIDSPKEVRALSERVFDAYWETSRPATIGMLARVLPVPSINWMHRIVRVCLPPLMLLERLKDACVGAIGPRWRRWMGASPRDDLPEA